MNARRLLPVLAIVCVAVLVWTFRHRVSFQPELFLQEVRFASPLGILLAFALTFFTFGLRALRWSVLIAPMQKVSASELLPSQLMGFAAVGLFGRVADLARPYLVARRTGSPVALQVAVYSIERAFDLAAAATLFSVTLAFVPASAPHHQAFARAGIVSLAATAFLAIVASAVRFTGATLSRIAGRLLRPFSLAVADAVSARLLELQEGFQTIRSWPQFLYATAISLVMWLAIALVYLECARAFQASPELRAISFTSVMLLMATSIGASLLQLPVLGWFTQIAVIAAAYHAFFGVPLEPASACATLTVCINTVSVVPAGMIAARMQGVRLRDTRNAPVMAQHG